MFKSIVYEAYFKLFLDIKSEILSLLFIRSQRLSFFYEIGLSSFFCFLVNLGSIFPNKSFQYYFCFYYNNSWFLCFASLSKKSLFLCKWNAIFSPANFTIYQHSRSFISFFDFYLLSKNILDENFKLYLPAYVSFCDLWGSADSSWWFIYITLWFYYSISYSRKFSFTFFSNSNILNFDFLIENVLTKFY